MDPDDGSEEVNMNRTLTLLGIGSAVMALALPALAQPKTDLGKREYDSNCASCHGADGKGGGAYVELLKRSPPDLTTMAKRNGGVFPLSAAYDVIEGRGRGHGSSDMPIWGQDYKVRAGEYYVDVPYNPEVYVRTRILALIEYLNRLQVK
jgi:mono/diheme cytochrome c family protein